MLQLYISLAFFAGFNPGLTLYSCSYSSQALEGYKLKAECLFLICLGLLFALNCSFWYVLRSTKVARCLDRLCQKNRNERRENENDKTVHQ